MVRPVREDDAAGLLALSQAVGPGFTSLQPDMGYLTDLAVRSAAAFTDGGPARARRFLLVMAQADTGAIIGCAGVKGAGADRHADWLMLDATGAPTSDPRAAETLTLADSFSDTAEVGVLALAPDQRGNGIGRPLAQSRYAFLAAAGAAFPGSVTAVLRGFQSEPGRSPFFDAVLGRQTGWSFTETDSRLARGDADVLAAAAALGPINVSDLPEAARAAMGQTHKTGRGARALLEQEGFSPATCVDVFDGGPLMRGRIAEIATTKAARQCVLNDVSPAAISAPLLIAAGGRSDFRAAVFPQGAQSVQAVADVLNVGPSDAIWALSAARTPHIAQPRPSAPTR